MAGVRFENVDKTYAGGHPAIVDLSLDIADGELMVIVGPSGCGKSTLLRLLAGLEEPDGGYIRIGDRIVNRLSPQARNIAMVFQDYALYPNMSVRGNLEFPLRMRKQSAADIKARIDRVVAMLNLADVLDRLPKQLSGGQRQRVAMGRALVREPSVFLLDEPLSNLDAKLRVQVRAEIADLQRRMGTTMIYVTHDQVEAMTLGRRIAVLDRGRLQQVAGPKALYDEPANTFVAGFIGNPPMNLLPTRVTVDVDGRFGIAFGERFVPLANADAERLEMLVGRPVVAGVRPEAFRLAGGDGFSATLELLEFLGHESLLHFRAAGVDHLLIARLPGLHDGGLTDLRLELDAGAIVLFAESGEVIFR